MLSKIKIEDRKNQIHAPGLLYGEVFVEYHFPLSLPSRIHYTTTEGGFDAMLAFTRRPVNLEPTTSHQHPVFQSSTSLGRPV